MIELRDVTKTFQGVNVVNDVTVSFEPGEISGVIGRNGSGKTVLFKMICGLLRPTSGKVIVDDKVVGKDIDFPESLGCIIEAPGFLPYESGYQNLIDLASIRHRVNKQRIREVMKIVALDWVGRKPVGKYSLGMKQRLGLAQAILENPDILVLDEPMNGLDEQGVEIVRRLLLDLKEQGKTILIASHNREDIDILCDKVYRMRDGQLREEKLPNGNP